MENRRISVILIFSALLIFSGCKKEEVENTLAPIQGMKVFSELEINAVRSMLAGPDEVLCMYQDKDYVNWCIMLDNDGNKKWMKSTAEIGLQISSESAFYSPKEDLYVFLHPGGGVEKISRSGELVYQNANFFELISNYIIVDAKVGHDNNYLVYGRYKTYGFAAIYDEDGNQLNKLLYYIHHPEPHSINGATKTPDGGYMFMGSQSQSNPPNLNKPNRFFIFKTNGDLDIELDQRYEASEPFVTSILASTSIEFTSDLIRLDNGNYVGYVNAANAFQPDLRSREVVFNSEGEIVSTTWLDDEHSNRVVKALKAGDGRVEALVNSERTTSIFFTATMEDPHHTYISSVNAQGNHMGTAVMQNLYSDKFEHGCTLSNGKLAFFGFINSFDGKRKPVIIIK